MGFDYHPYKHLEIVNTGDDDFSGWHWYCHNCGGEGKQDYFTTEQDALFQVLCDWEEHLEKSHDVSPDSFPGWGVF